MASGRVGTFGLLLALNGSLGGAAFAQADDLLMQRAEGASVRGDWQVAEAAYSAIIGEDANHLAAQRGLAFVLGEQGRVDAALEAYGEVLRISPRDPRALFSMAALVDRFDRRRSLPYWLSYLAAAEAMGAERPSVGVARARVRVLSPP